MTDATKPALGLSVGATTLTAVTADRTVTRKPADFVDRVGDPVGIVAPDGSVHPAETLLADALRALAYEATAGRALPAATAITHPAHWRTGAVEALRRALRRIPEWASNEPLLIADTAAAATALHAYPGLPTRGVIALCDFGGSGTSITLLDAEAGYRPIAPTVRHLDFSGDLIDRGLLAHVVTELSAGGSLDVTGTSAIGSLTRLRADCRAAKERLSTVTVTAVPADLPGFRGDVRLTRAELDDTVRRSLADLVAAVQDTLARAGVRPGELAAVASVGGGAAIPVVTTTMSEHLRVPVVTTTRPAATAAIGAALRAARGPADDNATAVAAVPAAVAPALVVAADPEPAPALAWSEAADVPDLAPPVRERPPVAGARPVLAFEPEPAEPVDDAMAWYRRPLSVVAAALLVIFLAGAGTFIALRNDSSAATPAAPAPSISTTPESAPAVDGVPPPAPADRPDAVAETQAVQAPRTVVQAPDPVIRTQVVQAPPVTTEAPPPPPITETTTVVTTEMSTPPPVTETATVPPPTQQAPLIPRIPAIPQIPGLPQFFPQPQGSG